jgi:hypothetical protein
VVTGLLTLTNGGFSTGTINAQGDIAQTSGYDGGSGTLNFANDAVVQTYTVNGGETPFITFDDPDDANDDIDVVATSSFQGFVVTSGFSGLVPLNNPSDYVLTFAYIEMASGTWDSSTQTAWNVADFEVTGGTLTPAATVTTTGSGVTWNFNVTQTFNNININRSGGQNLTITSGDTILTTGTMTLTNGNVNTGTLEAQGDVSVVLGFDGGTAPLKFSGSATQSFTLTSAAGSFDADIQVNKAGGQVNLTTALTLDASSQDLVIQEGKFNLNGQTMIINGTGGVFTVEDGGNFQLQGAETITLNASQPTLSTGSTVTYVGNGTGGANTYTITTLKDTYHHLVINSTDGATDTFQLGAALDVNGNLTNTAGTLDVVSGQNRAITLAGNWSNTGTFSAQAGTVTLDANTAHSVSGATTWNNLTLLESSDNTSSTTLTLAASTTQTISGTLTLDGLDSNDKLLIVSSSPSTEATINFTGSSTFSGDFLTVTDNDVTDNSSGISVPLNPASSTNGGNTTNWFSNAGVTVSAISGNTTEALGTATFTVVLNDAPTDNVVVESASLDSTEGTVTTGSSLTFTTGNWATPQTVTVTGVNDDVDDGDIAYTIDVSTNDTTTLDNTYDAVDPADVSVTNTDNDTAGVTVSTISGNTTEAGGTATFTVVLTSEPTGSVQVDSVSSDSTEGTVTTGSALTFTTGDWATPQTVTVTGANDDIDDGNIAYTIQTSTNDAATADAQYDAIDPNDVSVSNTDNDTSGATLVESGGTTANSEAGPTSDDFTLVLTAQPTATVTVNLTYDSDISSVTNSLTFTTGDWSTPQQVTVTAVDDDIDETSPHTGTVSFAFVSGDSLYNNLVFSNLNANVTDNDSSAITVSAISGNTTEAGGTATYTVVLETLPSADVTIGVSSNDATEGVVTSSATLTFTAGDYSTPQTVTVTGQNDAIDDGNVAYMIVNATASSADSFYNGINPADVDVTNTDNDTAGITLLESGGTTEVDELGPSGDTYTLVLTSEPTANVSIVLVYESAQLTLATSPVVFTSLNWSTPQTVTVTPVDDTVDEASPHLSEVTHSVSSDDSVYNGFSVAAISVSILDDDLAAGGGSSVIRSFVTAASVEVTNQTASCETSDQVTVIARAQGAVRVYLANDPDFLTEAQFDFEPDDSYAVEGVPGMAVPWTLAGNEGDQTVYTIFVSSTNNRLPYMVTTVALGSCQPIIIEEPPTEAVPTPEPTIDSGFSPYDGTFEQVTLVAEGQAFRGEHYSTIYILEQGERRPYLNEEVFFSRHASYDEVLVVTDVTLTIYEVGAPVLPSPGKLLVKIDSSPEVYVVEHPNILHRILSEAEAENLLGSAWDLFVINLPSTIFGHYIIAEPVSSLFPWDISYFFSRFGLQSNDDDRDGLTNDLEDTLGTNPKNNDTDGDRLPDYAEVRDGTDPLKAN